jgi:hypothetical protein
MITNIYHRSMFHDEYNGIYLVREYLYFYINLVKLDILKRNTISELHFFRMEGVGSNHQLASIHVYYSLIDFYFIFGPRCQN